MAQTPLTQDNLPDQTGKVFIITGSTAGIGKSLAHILYAHHAKVYVAARSPAKAESTIHEVQQSSPESRGSLVFLQLDLNDLSEIKQSAERFLAQEQRLDVLWNNAGVMIPPQGSKTKQGYELQLGVNNLGPFLFTKLLTPLLRETAKGMEPGGVRVVWVSASAAKYFAPKGGVDMDNLAYRNDKAPWTKYAVSKAGNIYHSKEFARLYGRDGIMSISLDPGFLKTELQVNVPHWQNFLLNLFVLKPAIQGAYVELFAGLSKAIEFKDNGAFIEPPANIVSPRKDIELGSKPKAEGGTGIAQQFWKWSESQVAPYI